MRPTLALSALLLLLLSPPSLSQSNAPRHLLSSVVSLESPECERFNCYQVSNLPIPKLQAHTAGDTDSATSTTTTVQNPMAATTISTSTKPTVRGTTTAATLSSATLSSAQPNTTQPKDSVNPVQSLTPTPTSSATSSAPGSMENQSGGGPTPPINSTQDDKTKTTLPSTSVPPSSSGQPVSSGGNSSANVTRAPPSTMESNQLSSNASSQPTGLFVSTTLPPTATASPRPSVATPSQSTESHPGGQHSPTTVPSSSASSASTNISDPSRRPTTQTPPGTTAGTQATTSQVPGVPPQTLATPLKPTESPVMATTEQLTHSSSDLTPSAPHAPRTPSPVWTFGHYKLKCDPAVMPDEELLILNLTRASLCERSPPDEKLVELLCHSVKASFKPAQDQCTIEMAPVLGRQAVAVKRVIIETKLPPKTVFELLKDKWDDLREAGVSDMMLGKEGPPEANEDRFSLPLIITIVCMASFLLLVAALYGCCHQRVSQRKDQQRLTEELQTVENGYHDNPTLEVMETPSEMQEKKVVSLNGELGDSWIVPLDNLTKDDLDEEEDTHL